MKNNKGKIFIAGAGPGDIGLITVKLQAVLRIADVVLCDYLINKSILALCKDSSIQVSVGKSGLPNSEYKFIQEDIHKLMIDHARAGKTVLRLKGGDPFIFGRGSEECEKVVEEGIDFEVIPGISSVSAGLAYAGIPLTHRDISRSVAIATGHLSKGESANNIKIPRADTIIFVMAMKNLAVIVDKFLDQNYPKQTTCALIENACSSRQRTFITTLKEAVAIRDKEGVKPPALFVVGEVTLLHEKLNWFEKKPLFGKTFLVTRTQKQLLVMSQTIQDLGAAVIEYPVIDIIRIDKADKILLQNNYLDKFSDVIFTSASGVEIFFDILSTGCLDSRALSGKTISSIGKITSNKLLEYGIKADIVPDVYQAEGILQKLDKDLSGRTFLLPRAKGARMLLIDEIRSRNAEIQELQLYEAKPPCGIDSIDKNLELDGICFTSTSSVVNFCKYNSNFKDTKIFTIGKITEESAIKNGFNDIEVSKEATIDSMINKIIEVNNK